MLYEIGIQYSMNEEKNYKVIKERKYEDAFSKMRWTWVRIPLSPQGKEELPD